MHTKILRHVSPWALALAALSTLCLRMTAQAGTSSTAQAPSPADLSLPASQWAQAAALSEEPIVNYDAHRPVRYQLRRVDSKGDTLREVIETTDGPVARLLSHDGQTLTSAEDAAERERLQATLDNPDTFFRHQHREQGSRSYALELLRTMPRAMLWSYVPGQPQLPQASRPAVVLDFKPDPTFKPPSLITESLTGVTGRLWVDIASHTVTRIQGEVLHPVDFGWGGLLARVRQGGTVMLEQTEASNGRWLFSHLVEHLAVREILVRSIEENADTKVTGVQPLPRPVPYAVAVQMLLTMPVSTR